jgi:hypothetical protein
MTIKTLVASAADLRADLQSDGHAAGWGELLSAGLVTLGLVVALLI